MESHPHVFGQITLSRERYEANMAKAVAEEREACAKIALDHGKSSGDNCWNHENSMHGKSRCWIEIAEAIKARGV